MSDLISRQAAIDALGEKPLAWEQGEYEEGLQTQWESDVEAIKALPSAQPEPQYKTKHGYIWLCPKCGLPVHSDYTKCVRCGYDREKGV